MFSKSILPLLLPPKFAFIATACRPTVAFRACVSRISSDCKFPDKQVLNSVKGF